MHSFKSDLFSCLTLFYPLCIYFSAESACKYKFIKMLCYLVVNKKTIKTLKVFNIF